MEITHVGVARRIACLLGFRQSQSWQPAAKRGPRNRRPPARSLLRGWRPVRTPKQPRWRQGKQASSLSPRQRARRSRAARAPRAKGLRSRSPPRLHPDGGICEADLSTMQVPPKQSELRITADAEYCGPHHPLDESLVVDPSSLGIANVLVSLYRGSGTSPPAVHPSYAATANDKVLLDNSKCRFDPHIVRLRTSQTLQVMNTDAVAHNTKIDPLKNPPINPTLPAGGTLEHRFPLPELTPAPSAAAFIPG